jgi:hypothetical protein
MAPLCLCPCCPIPCPCVQCFQRGFLKENQNKQLIKIDVNKTSKIFDVRSMTLLFLPSSACLNTTNTASALFADSFRRSLYLVCHVNVSFSSLSQSVG